MSTNTEKKTDAIERKEEVPLLSLTPSENTKNNLGQ